MVHFQRHPLNPIIVPGGLDWRAAVVFNPGVLYEGGKFYLYERAAGGLRPFICRIGMLESEDGVHFRQVGDRPVFGPEDCGEMDAAGRPTGSKYGSVQDPRVVKIGDTYYMTFAYRPFAWSSHPTGVGVPESHETEFAGVARAPAVAKVGSANVSGARPDNNTRSGIAVSQDRVKWRFLSWVSSPEVDDRDVLLFPEKIGGKFAALRRPLDFVGARYGTKYPSIWITFSEDLKRWDEPRLLAKPEFGWEDNRIGGSVPPIKTERGWLVIYHGVEMADAGVRKVIYRQGAMMLDLADPGRVIARSPEFIMEPEEYYEKFGTYIPNVVFATGAVVKEGMLHLYYGCCDTAIGLATARLSDVVDAVMRHPV